MKTLPVVELFRTVQGEGLHIGAVSTFLRLGRCNLECTGCDTKWDEFVETDFDEIVNKIIYFSAPHLVITGGEPTLYQKQLSEFLPELCKKSGYPVVTIETNGAVPLKGKGWLAYVNLWSFSPKVGSLGADQTFNWQTVFSNLKKVGPKRCQLKYVLDPDDDEAILRIAEFQKVVTDLKLCLPDRTYFQPLDTGTQVNVLQRVEQFNPLYYSVQLHKLTQIVDSQFNGNFKVLPQLHKYISYR